jgi:asparagine synthase (glutamine-hydrolysing)
MSGICAVWHKENPERISNALASLNAGLSVAPSERNAQESIEGAGVGVSAGFPNQQIWRDGQVMLACDADLLNEAELAATLGHRAEASERPSTAALLAALYERFGRDFVEKLRGTFSVVLWDRRERRFLAAIDGFGVKRLAYYHDDRVLLIASRVDAFARLGELDLEINPRAIANILNFSANLAPETIFTKIHRLIPGARLVVNEWQVRVEKYWDFRYGVEDDRGEARLSRELESVVERSVAAHCHDESFSELGAYLSGGTDSSTVLGMMTRAAQGSVRAFSIGFQEERFNELEYARLAAKKFGSEHHTYLVGPQDCFEALPRMVRYFDEPFGNSSAIPTYFCARLAAENGVKTLLAGDGGDELFGGNERYATDKAFEIYHRVPRMLRKGLIEPIVAGLPMEAGLVKRARGYIRRANLPGVERMLSYQFLRTHPPAEIFEEDFLRALGQYSVLDIPASHYAQAQARDHLDRLLYVDTKITLADNDLPKVTCMSELAGIQTRFPFLDRSVAEFSGRIPARLKVKGFNKRYLFKRAFRDLLPIEIIGKKKHGFGIPVAGWMTSDKGMRELSRDTLLSARTFSRGYFKREFIEDLFRKHETEDSTYYGDTIWTFLALELWHRQVVDKAVETLV